MLRVAVVTLFPEMLRAVTEYGITGRAVKNGLLEVIPVNPRDYTSDPHRTVDDRPYGGGPGMVMMVEPLRDAILAARKALTEARVAYLSPQGRRLDQQAVLALAGRKDLILVAGRYEGIDERRRTAGDGGNRCHGPDPAGGVGPRRFGKGRLIF